MTAIANFQKVEETKKHVLIKDIGPWDKFMTITNAAEWVVNQIAPTLNGRRLYYIDSDGEYAELLVDSAGIFSGFSFVEKW